MQACETLRRIATGAAALALCGLSGCASSSLYEQTLICPHFFTEPMWQAAERQVASVTVLRDVSKACGGFAAACTIGHDIYLPAGNDQDHHYVHEVCHVYRLHVMGLPAEQEAAHVGWIKL